MALSVFDKHQLRIARDTLKMAPEMVAILGGMTMQEAEEVVRKLKPKERRS